MSGKPIPEAWMTPGGDVSRSFYWCLERCLPGQQPRPLYAAQQQGQAVAWMTPGAIAHLAKQNGPAKVDAWNCASGADRVPLYAAPPSAPVGAMTVQTALRNLPQYISKCSLIGPDKHSAMLCFETLREALAQQPAAVDEVKIDMALAERVMDALGRFTSDEGWSAADIMTADAFGAALATQHQEPTT